MLVTVVGVYNLLRGLGTCWKTFELMVYETPSVPVLRGQFFFCFSSSLLVLRHSRSKIRSFFYHFWLVLSEIQVLNRSTGYLQSRRSAEFGRTQNGFHADSWMIVFDYTGAVYVCNISRIRLWQVTWAWGLCDTDYTCIVIRSSSVSFSLVLVLTTLLGLIASKGLDTNGTLVSILINFLVKKQEHISVNYMGVVWIFLTVKFEKM